MARDRNRDADQTARRRIDVARAFGLTGEEVPTRPAVHAQVPLDAVPILAVPRGEVPWDSLRPTASQVMLRVDGTTCVMVIATDTSLAPADVASELAFLATQGLVHLVAPPSSSSPEPVAGEGPRDDSGIAEIEVQPAVELELDLTAT